MARSRRPLLLSIALIQGACAHCDGTTRRFDLPDDPYGALPDGREALLAESDRMVTRGPSGPSVARSYRAAEYCLTHYDGGGDARWRVARSLYFLTLTASSADDAAHLADRCMGLEVEDEDPAEAHFYLALCMGARALARNMEGLSLIPKMVEQAELAAEKNPKVAHAGPHRLLGGIYLRAPAWPLSVGDLDEALEHLEKARDLGPRWAENHLMLAEALIEDGRKDEARTAFDRARSLLREPESEGWRDLWRRDIDALAPKLGK